ncbi:M16 family metallopeptidase [Nonomuraea sp. NPDC048826]|uniref:M16 family metallopeptidase n=1 Tax=Nonomuraea sp. NPDC048826 TaxID=3364347 RepID=UPI0037182AD6
MPATPHLRRTVLPSGLRVITERTPGEHAAAFGVWAATGSRDESDACHGASHFLEHVVFKGTGSRTGERISVEMDATGGESNALTAKEHTAYYAKVLLDDLPGTADLVCDLVADPVLDEADLEIERGVLLNELAMQRDDPFQAVQQELAYALFADARLARPAGGTEATVGAMKRDVVAAFHAEHYVPEKLVVVAAGDLDHERVADLAAARLLRRFGDRRRDPVPPRPGSDSVPALPARCVVLPRSVELASLVAGVPGIAQGHEARYAMAVLSTAVGGGISARLFKELRERRGLAYALGSHVQTHSDAGAFVVHGVCRPADVPAFLSGLREELGRIAADGLDGEEVERAQRRTRGRLALSLADPLARVSALANAELSGEPPEAVGEMIRAVGETTVEEVRDLASQLFSAPLSVAAAGPFPADQDFLSEVN